MASSVVKVWFRAVSPVNHTYFTFAYGPRYAEPYIADEMKDLVKHIAYYWHRCPALLEVSTNGLTWREADGMQQKSFCEMLDFEFFQYEIH